MFQSLCLYEQEAQLSLTNRALLACRNGKSYKYMARLS